MSVTLNWPMTGTRNLREISPGVLVLTTRDGLDVRQRMSVNGETVADNRWTAADAGEAARIFNGASGKVARPCFCGMLDEGKCSYCAG